MKIQTIQRITSALLIALIESVCLQSQSPIGDTAASQDISRFVGIWQGELDGLPSAILTLAADDGTLQGTLVMNGISREGGSPHIAVRETHLLLHPSLSGTTLSFAVKGRRGTMDFTVERTSNTSANIHCLNCGSDSPTVEITKLE